MPYPKNSDLPTSVRRSLPEEAQTRFRQVVNSALDRGLDEGKAFASAWSVVRNGWKQSEGGRWVRKRGSPSRTLFAHRKLENADELIEWAKAQGFPTTMPADELHVTIAYSKEALVWPEPETDIVRVTGGERRVKRLGHEDEVGWAVLRFNSAVLTRRWSELKAAGASWDYPSYQAHVSITENFEGVDLSKVEPFDGDLIFGPEIFRELDEDWKSGVTEKSFTKAEVFKVDRGLGLIFGWAIVCKTDGAEYWDTQGDHIPEDAMLKAATDFMLESRKSKDMHAGAFKGTVVFAFPLTEDIAKAMGISSVHHGLMIAAKPDDPAMLEKYASGEYTGFSIGGKRIQDKAEDDG